MRSGGRGQFTVLQGILSWSTFVSRRFCAAWNIATNSDARMSGISLPLQYKFLVCTLHESACKVFCHIIVEVLQHEAWHETATQPADWACLASILKFHCLG